MPHNYRKGRYNLGSWVLNQRRNYSKEELDPERIERLEGMPGWTWDPQADDLEEAFAILEQFVDREGHARVPRRHEEAGHKLGMWVVHQRYNYSKGKLEPERVERLEAVPGWTWDPGADKWEEAFASLEQFVDREGHARVPHKYRHGGHNLGVWVGTQRKWYSKGKIEPDRVERLEAVPGWTWDALSD